jgi:hypothetical protein
MALCPQVNYTDLCGLLLKFLAVDTEVSGSIPGATRFSEEQWFWNGVHLTS